MPLPLRGKGYPSFANLSSLHCRAENSLEPVAREFRQGPKGEMDIVGEGKDVETVVPPGARQRVAAEQRNVAVAWADIPPMKAKAREVVGLHQGRKQHQTGIAEIGNDRANALDRVGHVLERLKTGDQVEFSRRRLREVGNERIVGDRDRKTGA